MFIDRNDTQTLFIAWWFQARFQAYIIFGLLIEGE